MNLLTAEGKMTGIRPVCHPNAHPLHCRRSCSTVTLPPCYQGYTTWWHRRFTRLLSAGQASSSAPVRLSSQPSGSTSIQKW